MYAGYGGSYSEILGNSHKNSIENWLYKGQEWLINSRYDNSNDVYRIMYTGYLDDASGKFGSGFRPTFYLKSDVKIIGGDGSVTNPYQIRR